MHHFVANLRKTGRTCSPLCPRSTCVPGPGVTLWLWPRVTVWLWPEMTMWPWPKVTFWLWPKVTLWLWPQSDHVAMTQSDLLALAQSDRGAMAKSDGCITDPMVWHSPCLRRKSTRLPKARQKTVTAVQWWTDVQRCANAEKGEHQTISHSPLWNCFRQCDFQRSVTENPLLASRFP